VFHAVGQILQAAQVRHRAGQVGECLGIQLGQRLGEDRPAPGHVPAEAVAGLGGEVEVDHAPVLGVAGPGQQARLGQVTSAQTYALMFGANALGLVLLGQLNARLLDQFGPRTLMRTALLANLAATAVLVVVAGLDSLTALGVLLFASVASLGMVMPNGTSLALDRHPERAGTAAALLGAGQFAIGALVAPLVGLAGESSARPMALVMLGCAVLAVSAFAVSAPARARRASPAPEHAPR
jgi:MFS family permease